jgi:hypothetical protein
VLIAQVDAATSPPGPTNPPTTTGAASGTGLSIPDASASSDGAASNATSNTTTSAAGSNEPADEPAEPVTTDPGVDSAACITAQSAANFTLMDQNPPSPTYNQMRSLHDICGKVLLVMYTAFHWPFCTPQFGALDELYQEWERDGYGYDDVEIWAISIPGEEWALNIYLQGTDHSAFLEEEAREAAASLGTTIFGLVILDRHLVVHKRLFTSFSVDLETAAGKDQVDTIVRGLF